MIHLHDYQQRPVCQLLLRDPRQMQHTHTHTHFLLVRICTCWENFVCFWFTYFYAFSVLLSVTIIIRSAVPYPVPFSLTHYCAFVQCARRFHPFTWLFVFLTDHVSMTAWYHGKLCDWLDRWSVPVCRSFVCLSLSLTLLVYFSLTSRT